jgi:cytochrome c biogenesis protein CcdA
MDILAMVVAFSLGMFMVYIIFGVGLFRVLQENSTQLSSALLWQPSYWLGADAAGRCQEAAKGGTSSFARTDQKCVYGVIASRSLSAYFLRFASRWWRLCGRDGIHLAIISMISSQGYASSGLLYLVIYNVGIALPVLAIGGIISLGMSPEQVDLFRNKHRIAIRLITGITLIATVPLIYWQLI